MICGSNVLNIFYRHNMGATTTTTHYAHPNEGAYPAGNTTGMAHATTTATPQGVNVV